MRYVIGDTHFEHDNIIEYCDRPFSSVEEMNKTMLERWNHRVDEDDVVYHLGDFALYSSATEWDEKLNGNIVLVTGNHDTELDPDSVPFPIVDGARLNYGGINFELVHRPRDFMGTGEWTMHGHHHDNDAVEWPYVHAGKNTVNVSAEVIGYAPISLREVFGSIAETSEQKIREYENEEAEQ